MPATSPQHVDQALSTPSPPPSAATPAPKPSHRKLWIRIGILLVLVAAAIAGIPWLIRSFSTVSTDDAYVNGHVTFVAPRIAGQVTRVLVDDNNRVRKGDLLVEIDKKPFIVQVEIAQAAVDAAKADLSFAQAQARATVGQTRSQKFNLDRAMEDVHNQIQLLNLKVATLNSQQATLTLAQANYDRIKPAFETKAVSKEEFDQKSEALDVAKAKREEALQAVYQVRVSLGLPPIPGKGETLSTIPKDLDETFSSVKQAQASVMNSAAKLGVIYPFDKSPSEMIKDFLKRDPEGKENIDRIYAQLLKDAPSVKQAETKLSQAKSNLDQANLNLSYCEVRAEIDGVVARRNVNPGNNVVAGQTVMAVRSLTEIWVDANFKETQLADLRIGQAVDLDVDMYGSRQRFQGRISGFTMGTGSTLALLPAENATGNFVKVVQRLPVRIELTDYDPDKTTLFIGLSVTPHVRINVPPTGPDAGKLLQPYRTTATAPDGSGQ